MRIQIQRVARDRQRLSVMDKLKLIWLQLDPHQRRHAKALYWAVNLNMSFLFLLAALTLAAKQDLPITLYLSSQEANSVSTSFELTDTLSIESIELPVVEEILLEELPSLETPIAEPTLNPIELEPVKTQGENVEVDATDSELVSMESSISKLEKSLVEDTNRRVAQAGGKLEGPIRISLAFSGDDDLDLHLKYELPPIRNNRQNFGFNIFAPTSLRHLFFGIPQSEHASLDVDANAQQIMVEPCENIVFHSKPNRTRYYIALDNYTERGIPDKTPYVVVVKYGRKTKVFQGELAPQDRMKEIWDFRY